MVKKTNNSKIILPGLTRKSIRVEIDLGCDPKIPTLTNSHKPIFGHFGLNFNYLPYATLSIVPK